MKTIIISTLILVITFSTSYAEFGEFIFEIHKDNNTVSNLKVVLNTSTYFWDYNKEIHQMFLGDLSPKKWTIN